jgi:hypothetical protein
VFINLFTDAEYLKAVKERDAQRLLREQQQQQFERNNMSAVTTPTIVANRSQPESNG